MAVLAEGVIVGGSVGDPFTVSPDNNAVSILIAPAYSSSVNVSLLAESPNLVDPVLIGDLDAGLTNLTVHDAGLTFRVAAAGNGNVYYRVSDDSTA